jgi:hypothetical protein
MLIDPQTKLCQSLIEEYLHSKGFTWENVCELPEGETKRLLTEASMYAALKLAEDVNRAHLLQDIHGSAQLG